MTLATPAPAVAAADGASLWQLGLEAHELQRAIEDLALELDSDDDERVAEVTAALEALLAAEEGNQAALHRKADAYCWVIENLRGLAAYRQQQARRLADLAGADQAKADRLEAALLKVLTRQQPDATKFELQDHVIASRRSESVEIDELERLPIEFLRIQTTTSADKRAIKAAIKNGEVVQGARLEARRSWSIK